MLNPNLVATWLFSGWVRDWLGEPEVALEHTKQALRLSPLDPLIFRVQGAIALAHFLSWPLRRIVVVGGQGIAEQFAFSSCNALRCSKQCARRTFGGSEKSDVSGKRN